MSVLRPARRPIEYKRDGAAEHLACAIHEVKFAEGDGAGGMLFSGYGAVFGNTDAWGDVIQPGAFADTLAAARKTGQWPAMLLQHGGFGLGAEDLTPIGIWTDLAEDGVGLRVEGKLADTARGREAYALLKMQPRPAITGLSIGYIAKEWIARSRPDEPRRTLKKVDLIEVSLVTFPANPRARVDGVKTEPTIRMAEKALRDAGFSGAAAKQILAAGYKSLGQRDVDEGLDDLAALLRRNTELINP